jgi:phosphoribosylamine--glycine ligase
VDDILDNRIRTEILDRFIAGIKKDGLDFRGMLFPGLMLTASGPKVLEFNCRWGDPETQVLVRRLESDLLPLLESAAAGALGTQSPAWDTKPAVCVILASGGYPTSYTKGKTISGLANAAELESVEIFHAGTKTSGDTILTNGGRVLGVTAKSPTLEAARSLAYQAADKILFDGVHRRNDIGARPRNQ